MYVWHVHASTLARKHAHVHVERSVAVTPITMDDEDHDEDDSTQPESPAERKLEEAIEASE